MVSTWIWPRSYVGGHLMIRHPLHGELMIADSAALILVHLLEETDQLGIMESVLRLDVMVHDFDELRAVGLDPRFSG